MARIAEIRLTGTGQTDALVRFKPGPNVITGDSDTGKSYLLRLVDYVLGAEELKKVIDSRLRVCMGGVRQ
ncbi:DNA repair ATPase RecN [Rhizobium sp. BK650]|nr:DNA repair ATPase RecN [Rhizobium sp. BK650]